MPRESEASITIAHVGPGARRLEPPPELGEIEAAIFRNVVAGVPRDHFSAEDNDLLSAYCRAIALERRASEELATAATIGGQASPWLAVYATAVRALATLTVRLRLGPKARHPNNARRLSKSVSPQSYYDTMTIAADAQPRAPQEGRPDGNASSKASPRQSRSVERAIRLLAAGGTDALQMQRKLKDEPWIEAAQFAAYACQDDALRLKPWQPAPCWMGDDRPVDDFAGAGRVAAWELRRRLIAWGLSGTSPIRSARCLRSRRALVVICRRRRELLQVVKQSNFGQHTRR